MCGTRDVCGTRVLAVLLIAQSCMLRTCYWRADLITCCLSNAVPNTSAINACVRRAGDELCQVSCALQRAAGVGTSIMVAADELFRDLRSIYRTCSRSNKSSHWNSANAHTLGIHMCVLIHGWSEMRSASSSVAHVFRMRDTADHLRLHLSSHRA